MTTDVNILIRGQSNALLFVADGGARELEKQLEASLPGVNVNIIQHYGDKNSTIYSGTAFLKWDTDGQQQGLLNYVKAEPADIKDNPTVTLWMHNEYDGNTGGVTTANWVSEVKTDAALVRSALGQSAATTPYVFTYVPYNYAQGNSPANIQAGMRQLSADSSFNATFDSTAMNGLTMNGDGYAHSSHMGQADAMLVADRLAADMKGIVANLAKGSGTTPSPTVPVTTPVTSPLNPPASGGVTKTIGAGSDSIVMKISQDAWNGNAQYTISVDGKQVGGILTASASHAAGHDDVITVKGDWSAGAHKVTVNFLNDAWGGTAATDRNLHVDGITYNGTTLTKGTADLKVNGPVSFAFTEGASGPAPSPAPSAGAAVVKTVGTGADSLVLKVSQDAYNGNAQYSVFVDGKQVGGTLTAGALHGSGNEDTVTIKGDWGTGDHKLTVRFLNDASGSGGDRNLYVDDASFNGSALGKHSSTFKISGPDDFRFTKTADGLGATFSGTNGKDVFAIQHGDGDMVIDRFTAGTDKLQFEGFDKATMHIVAASEGGVSGTLVIFDATAENVFLPHVTNLTTADTLFA